MSNEITRINPPTITAHTVVNYLQEIVSNIEEIYCVTKDKDGNWAEHHSGDVLGMAFALMIMQKHAMEVM